MKKRYIGYLVKGKIIDMFSNFSEGKANKFILCTLKKEKDFVSAVKFILNMLSITLFESMGEFDRALQYCRNSKAGIPEQMHGSRYLLGTLELRIASIYYHRGFLKESLAKLNSINKNLTKHNLKVMLAESSEIKGHVLRGFGKFNDAIKAYSYSGRVYESKSMKERRGIVYGNIGICNENLNNFKTALKYFKSSKELLKSRDMKLKLEGNLAVLYAKRGELNNALRIFKRCFRYFSKCKYVAGMIVNANNIAKIYEQKRDYKKGGEYLKIAYTIAKRIGAKFEITNCLINLGYHLSSLKKYGQAMRYYREALEICQKYGFTENKAVVLSYMGLLHFNRKDYTQARKYLSSSKDLSKEVGISEFYCESLIYLGAIEIFMKRPQPAEALLKQGLAIARKYGDIELEIMAKFYTAKLRIAEKDLIAGRGILKELVRESGVKKYTELYNEIVDQLKKVI